MFITRLHSDKAYYNSFQDYFILASAFQNIKIKIYETIIWLIVLYGCETWSLTLREEHRLGLFKKRVLRIFRPKMDEVTGGSRKLHNEELRVRRV
jgi:hypothetical protein